MLALPGGGGGERIDLWKGGEEAVVAATARGRQSCGGGRTKAADSATKAPTGMQRGEQRRNMARGGPSGASEQPLTLIHIDQQGDARALSLLSKALAILSGGRHAAPAQQTGGGAKRRSDGQRDEGTEAGRGGQDEVRRGVPMPWSACASIHSSTRDGGT